MRQKLAAVVSERAIHGHSDDRPPATAGKAVVNGGTFPFVAPADRSVVLSGILTAVCRHVFPTAPLHAFTAPTAGSGKSMPVDLCSLIATGRDAPVISPGESPAELEKRLTSMLPAGSITIAIDNCEAPLGGEFLNMMLTQERVNLRILGKSETPTLSSRALITATGNNLVLLGDMTRQSIVCRLDPRHERAELRSFATDPKAVVRADRGQYLIAALTVLRAFHVAGRQRQADPLGSFEHWSQWGRGALMWLGRDDPIATMEAARASDPRLEQLRTVMEQWDLAIGPDPITVRELVEKATATTSDGYGGSPLTHPDFREALLIVAGMKGLIESGRLGRYLRSSKDRIVGGRTIVNTGTFAGVAQWALTSVST